MTSKWMNQARRWNAYASLSTVQTSGSGIADRSRLSKWSYADWSSPARIAQYEPKSARTGDTYCPNRAARACTCHWVSTSIVPM